MYIKDQLNINRKGIKSYFQKNKNKNKKKIYCLIVII